MLLGTGTLLYLQSPLPSEASRGNRFGPQAVAPLRYCVTSGAPQIYVPRLPGIPNEFPYLPDEWRLGYEDVWLTTADGVRLHAWLMWPAHWGPAERRSRPTVMFFQENAGNMAFRCVLCAVRIDDRLQCSHWRSSLQTTPYLLQCSP